MAFLPAALPPAVFSLLLAIAAETSRTDRALLAVAAASLTAALALYLRRS